MGLAVGLVIVLLAASAWAAPATQPVVPVLTDEIIVSGKELHSFARDGLTTQVVVGDFKLEVGKRSLAGRDAVLWISERPLGGNKTVRDLEVYIEGDVVAAEPDGSKTTDRRMYVLLRQQGDLGAKVNHYSNESVESLPIYARAMTARENRLNVPPQPIALLMPGQVTTATTASTPVGSGPGLPATRPTTKPAKPAEYAPVNFRANSISSQEIPDPRNPGKKMRVTVAKGDVVITQGSLETNLGMQLRAQAAVIYSVPQAASSPASAPSQAVSPAGALGLTSERVIGVYMEGDVRLTRGERGVTGERLFYDFQTGKALIVHPVMRTVQDRRNIPMYLHASEGRQLAARESANGMRIEGSQWTFRDAVVTTSDFYTPEFSIAARQVYMEDLTPYADNKAADLPSWRTEMKGVTFDIYQIPVFWSPYTTGEADLGHTALRRASIVSGGRFGWGLETEWHLFRLIGIQPPEGVKGYLEIDGYAHGIFVQPKISYTKPTYSGYLLGSYVRDTQGHDSFGTENKDIPAPENRGRLLWRHKQFLPEDWEVQFELSYLSDKNFLRKYYPAEYWGGKPQDSLVYAKKQKDNWAFTVLAQWRIDDFLTQTESLPDLGAYLIGQPVGDALWFAEAHVGAVRYRPGEGPGSPTVARADTRQELDLPFGLGPVRLTPYVAGRGTGWTDTPDEGSELRAFGEMGLAATMHVWRIYDQTQSRLWDLNKIKHIITPYVNLFAADTNVQPDQLYPFSPDIEQYTRRLGGGQFGVRQVWQTKRGEPGKEHVVDWMRLDLYGAFFNHDDELPADGRFFWNRPEYSLGRNAVNGDYEWNISDSTAFLADFNYDTDSRRLALANAGISVTRSPRLKYYMGVRYIDELQSAVGTFGFNYQLTRKYSLNVFQQYDFRYQGGQNEVTTVSLVRRFPRWYGGVIVSYERTQNNVGVAFTLWPEGMPEARMGGSRFTTMQAFDDQQE